MKPIWNQFVSVYSSIWSIALIVTIGLVTIGVTSPQYLTFSLANIVFWLVILIINNGVEYFFIRNYLHTENGDFWKCQYKCIGVNIFLFIIFMVGGRLSNIHHLPFEFILFGGVPFISMMATIRFWTFQNQSDVDHIKKYTNHQIIIFHFFLVLIGAMMLIGYTPYATTSAGATLVMSTIIIFWSLAMVSFLYFFMAWRLQKEKDNEEDVDLKKIISQSIDAILEGIDSVITELAKIRHMSKEVSSNTSQITQKMVSLTMGNEEKSNQIQEINKSLNKTVISMEEILSISESIAQDGGTASQIANQNKVEVAKASEYLLDISGAVEISLDMSSELIEAMSKINDFVNIIKKIARKTSLLSLNASIEASRAGVEGRGFAIVAEEVKRLATASGDAAIEVERAIQEIRDRISDFSEAMNFNAQKVAVAREVSRSARIALDTMTESIVKISNSTSNILQKIEHAGQNLRAVVEQAQDIFDVIQSDFGQFQDTLRHNVELTHIYENVQETNIIVESMLDELRFQSHEIERLNFLEIEDASQPEHDKEDI